MRQLTLYGREYCGLCHVMRDALLAQAAGRFTVQWIDIEDIDELEARYGELGPVLTDEAGQEICHYHLDQAALDARLANLG